MTQPTELVEQMQADGWVATRVAMDAAGIKHYSTIHRMAARMRTQVIGVYLFIHAGDFVARYGDTPLAKRIKTKLVAAGVRFK